MPTWSTGASNARMSPGFASARLATGCPASACWNDRRGNEIPRSLYVRCTNAEQSSPLLGSVLPHTYGVPRYFLADVTTSSPETPPEVETIWGPSSLPPPLTPASVEAKLLL